MKLGKILRNGKISMHTKKRVLNCYVEPVLLYGSECWTISAQMKRKLRATELWFLQKNDENIMGRSRNQRGGLAKSWNGAEDYENHKEETD